MQMLTRKNEQKNAGMKVETLVFVLLGFFLMPFSYGQQRVNSARQYLSGTSAADTRTWDFWVTAGRKSGAWTTIEVPSHWEQQGFGAYNYGRDNVTFGRNFKYHDEEGRYKYAFEVSSEWKDRDIYIVFEGAMTDTEVRINGQLAGPVHQGAFYRFKYQVNDYLKWDGSNVLEVKVSKMSGDRSVNGAERYADYWIFGGIYRPVYLEAFPRENMEWSAIDARADGSFAMNAYLRHVKPGRTIAAEIVDENGILVGTATNSVSVGDTVVRLTAHVRQPRLWSAEFPNRYEVRVTILDGHRKLFESTEKFGFRTIEVRKGDGVYINGTKIKFKGINRHVFWPEYGRTTFPEADLTDVKLIKEMNMNAVRCAHYPPDKNFLNVCDSLGLYVINELAGWQTSYSTQAGIPLVKAMVQRDVNHPSVIFWSNGNEGGHNKSLVAEYAKYDLSNRPVIHAHHKPGNAINGIDCNHYEDYYSTKKILEDTLIYMPTEFLHAMHDGGGAAALADFWELHWHAKVGAGGFIWNLADEAMMRTDQNNRLDANGYNGPDGVVGPHRQKEGSAYAIKEIYAPVKIDRKEIFNGFDGKIRIENRYHFTNLKQCTFEFELANFYSPASQMSGVTVKVKKAIETVDIAPHDSGTLQLDLPADWKTYDVLALRAIDPHGQEIYRWTWSIKPNQDLLQELLSRPAKQQVEVEDIEGVLVLKGGDVTVEINKQDGLLMGAKNVHGAKISLQNGPLLVSGESSFESLRYYTEGEAVVVQVQYAGQMEYVCWKMYPNGILELNYKYRLQGNYPFAGVTFDYPESLMLGARWLGRGPARVWKNRLQGVSLGVFESYYNNTTTGREPWIYPEFKGYFSDVVWIELSAMEGKFLVATPDKGMYARLFDFYALYGAHPHPVLPGGDISFLDAIPATGTNIKSGVSTNVKNYGPDSEWNHLEDAIQRTLFFYFGVL